MAAAADIATTVSASVLGMQYFDLTTADFNLGSFTDHVSSGQVSLALGSLAPGDNVRTARVRKPEQIAQAGRMFGRAEAVMTASWSTI